MTTSITFALLAAAVLAPGVAAAGPTWTEPVTVRNAEEAELQDADFARHRVAITWQEPGSSGPSVRLRFSTDRGKTFGSAAVVQRARHSAVDWCATHIHPSVGDVEVAYARRIGPGNWVIEHAIDVGGWPDMLQQPVSPSAGIQRLPDIACAGEHTFISWFEREGTGDRLKVAHKRRPDGSGDWEGLTFTVHDLGFDDETFFGRSLAVAATPHTAYVVFSRSDGRLRFKRWTISTKPEFPLTERPTQVIANGRPDNAASDAVIAASGKKVAVAWFRCGGIFARVSDDRGRTWGPIREVLDHQACFGDFGASQRSIAIRGDRIVISYMAFGIPNVSWVGLIRTRSDFARFSDRQITKAAHDEHLVSYIVMGGRPKLAAAIDRGDHIRFRRQE